MAVDPVPGYGDINQGNAKEIYTAYRRGDVELNAAQKKYTEKFLTKEDFDEIDYQVAGDDGYNQIEDAKKADEHDGQGGNAAGTSAGMVAGAAGFCVVAKKSALDAGISGFVDLLNGILLAACGIAMTVFANAFDNGYDDRVEANNNSDATNETLDNNTSVLEESMDAMNEDAELYKDQSETYTNNVITQTVQLADLKAQLADAQAAGDSQGAKILQQQIQRLQKKDFGNDLEALEGTRAQLEEYSYANEMATGVKDAGSSVADFLKEGTPLGVVAAADTVALLVGLGLSATAMYRTIADEVYFFSTFRFAEAVAAGAAIALFAVGIITAGKAAYTMGDKAKHEFDCGSSGRDMQGHVDTLNDMLGQQEGYIETTTGEFDASDDQSKDNQDKAKDATSKALSGRTAGSGAVNDDKPSGDQPSGNQPSGNTQTS